MKDANCPICNAPWVRFEPGPQSLDVRLCKRRHHHGGSYISRLYFCANGHHHLVYRSGWLNVEGCPETCESVPWPNIDALEEEDAP